jgi:hypothetical protein
MPEAQPFNSLLPKIIWPVCPSMGSGPRTIIVPLAPRPSNEQSHGFAAGRGGDEC